MLFALLKSFCPFNICLNQKFRDNIATTEFDA